MKTGAIKSQFDLACELADKARDLTGTMTERAKLLEVSLSRLSKSIRISMLPLADKNKWRSMTQRELYSWAIGFDAEKDPNTLTSPNNLYNFTSFHTKITKIDNIAQQKTNPNSTLPSTNGQQGANLTDLPTYLDALQFGQSVRILTDKKIPDIKYDLDADIGAYFAKPVFRLSKTGYMQLGLRDHYLATNGTHSFRVLCKTADRFPNKSESFGPGKTNKLSYAEKMHFEAIRNEMQPWRYMVTHLSAIIARCVNQLYSKASALYGEKHCDLQQLSLKAFEVYFEHPLHGSMMGEIIEKLDIIISRQYGSVTRTKDFKLDGKPCGTVQAWKVGKRKSPDFPEGNIGEYYIKLYDLDDVVRVEVRCVKPKLFPVYCNETKILAELSRVGSIAEKVLNEIKSCLDTVPDKTPSGDIREALLNYGIGKTNEKKSLDEMILMLSRYNSYDRRNAKYKVSKHYLKRLTDPEFGMLMKAGRGGVGGDAISPLFRLRYDFTERSLLYKSSI